MLLFCHFSNGSSLIEDLINNQLQIIPITTAWMEVVSKSWSIFQNEEVAVALSK